MGGLIGLLYGTHLQDLLTVRSWGNLPFDPAQWEAATAAGYSPDCVRGKMVGALLRDFRLQGRTRREVVDLLGPPDWTHEPYSDKSRLNLDAGVFDYFLGNRVSFAIDDDYLELRFGPEGRVKAWGIETN